MRGIDACIDVRNADVLARNRHPAVQRRYLYVADKTLDPGDRSAFSIEQLEHPVRVERFDPGLGLEGVELQTIDRGEHDRELIEISTAHDAQRAKHVEVRARRLLVKR